MFDSVLFDLDGTLWDAVPEITCCWNQALSLHRVPRPPLTEAEVRSCMGMQLDDIAAQRLPMLSREEQRSVLADCCAIEMDYLARRGAALFPREEETLAALAARYPLFVVSNCQDGYIEAFYAGSGLGRYFADFECAGRTGKPKGDNIRLVMERHGLRSPVYVGDTPLDLQAAQAAGIPFLHAAYGFGQVENVPAIHAFTELPQALEALAERASR